MEGDGNGEMEGGREKKRKKEMEAERRRIISMSVSDAYMHGNVFMYIHYIHNKAREHINSAMQ